MADALGATEYPDPTNPASTDGPMLSKEERLELSLIESQKKVLQLQAQNEAGKLERSTTELISKVQGRLNIDLSKYKIDLDSGRCVLEDSAESN